MYDNYKEMTLKIIFKNIYSLTQLSFDFSVP